jgi:glycosyltransferase involved in cell wall biosynthesis
MTRLLQVMAGAKHGGAEAFFERLAIALHNAGEEQKLVIRRDAGRAGRLRAVGLDPVELRFGGALDVMTRPRLSRVIRSFGPRVVLTWMNRATQLCPRGDFVHVARLGGYYDLRYYRHCDHLIGNTRALTSWLVRQGWPEGRAHYLPNFADRTAVAPVARASLDTPHDAPLALALGRLHPNKGFDVLLAAVARVPGLYLWLAGDGGLEVTLKQQAASLAIADRVRFLGWREDAAGLLAACDMLVCSSRVEPLGNTIIEAWAARRPVIAAASTGPAELIADGKSGLLVPIDNAEALAAAASRVVADKALAHALADVGYNLYEAQFSAPRVVAAYREFLAKVAR